MQYICNPTLLYRCHFYYSEFFYSLLTCCYVTSDSIHSHVANEDRKKCAERIRSPNQTGCKFLTCLHQFSPVIAIQVVKTEVLPANQDCSPDEWQAHVLYIACQLGMASKKSSAHPAHALFPGRLNGKDRFASLEKRCTSPSRSISPASTV